MCSDYKTIHSVQSPLTLTLAAKEKTGGEQPQTGICLGRLYTGVPKEYFNGIYSLSGF